MRRSVVLLLAASLPLCTGCSSSIAIRQIDNAEKAEDQNENDRENQEEQQNPQQSGFVVTSDGPAGFDHFGFSLEQITKVLNLGKPRQIEENEYLWLAPAKDNYDFGIFINTNANEMVTGMSALMVFPPEDQDFQQNAVSLSLDIFKLIPEFKSETFAELFGRLAGSGEQKTAAGVFGSYGAGASVGSDEDRKVVMMEVVAWQEDRAAGDPDFEDIHRQIDLGMSETEAADLIEKGE